MHCQPGSAEMLRPHHTLTSVKTPRFQLPEAWRRGERKDVWYCTFAKYRLVNFETCAVRDKIRTTHSACHEEIV
eukprot:COSAG06_NODE_68119_length_239_cov_7.492857_1_plen_73_part_01